LSELTKISFVLNFGFRALGFVSDFVLRVSDLQKLIWQADLLPQTIYSRNDVVLLLPIFRLREQLKHGYNACLKKADSEWVVKSRVILISSENSNRVEQAFQTKRQEVGELFFGEIL
jgi:hypothetical protein